MGKDKLVDIIRSPLVRANLIEQIRAFDAKGATKQLYKHLDIFLTDKDIKLVFQEIKNKMMEFVRALDR